MVLNKSLEANNNYLNKKIHDLSSNVSHQLEDTSRMVQSAAKARARYDMPEDLDDGGLNNE